MKIGIVYSAFDQHVDQIRMDNRVWVDPSTTVSIDIPDCFAGHLEEDDRALYICELLFENTNTYEGPLWDRLDGKLPTNRTHTALSVGDRVFVGEDFYRCAFFGWEAI